jgi:hypothetical protein
MIDSAAQAPMIFYVLIVSYYANSDGTTEPVKRDAFPYLELETCLAAKRAVDARPPLAIDGAIVTRHCKHIAIELDAAGCVALATSIH